eukprot:CAMPEP_0174977182 /NCGR_PEP_ID=MMETSP0004_2-20121128/13462_1 /TAXON_ID=420556 /ORGANISM="Ochromonas sp., Strain CCMP1393" /LENGTH=552 /DNA_ID=CAMNT_0016228327 /DNA_START=66 /DNA_END=1724 /DNA_ORIENTATION=-
MRQSLPGFAPFASNTKRMVYNEIEDNPAPGNYELATNIARDSKGPGSIRSKTQRFVNTHKQEEMRGRVPGPGTYTLPSTFKSKKNKSSSREMSINEAISSSLGAPTSVSIAPSIPTKFQSYGYEAGHDGRLVLQEPLYPVYSGAVSDSVGPCEYDPRIDVKYKAAQKTNFSRSAERGAYDKITAKMTEAPGPGYYNYQSDFDLPEEHGTSSYADTNFLMQLNAARKRQSAVFESRTGRDALMQEISKKKEIPGPGEYDHPPAIKAPKVKPNIPQNFSSSGARFQDPMPRSMRLTTAPGAYSPITSDFDQMRLNILKKKKLAIRSGWAQNIAFASTETRFHMSTGATDVDGPPANAYYPKIGMADTVPRPNPRGGAFGAKETRFKEPKTNFEPIRDKYRLATVALNKELSDYLPPPPAASESSSPKRRTRPAFSRNFAPTNEDRLRPVKTPPGPPPGSYDVQPKWKTSGTHVMAPKVGNSKKRPDKMPGPGQYDTMLKMGKDARNPKNIMGSTSERRVWKKPNSVPGPGEYTVIPSEGSLLRHSHNVLLSDNY